MRATYVMRPDAIDIRTNDGIDYITLRENIEEKDASLTDDEPAIGKVWECDENQIVIPHGVLNLEEVRGNPSIYMGYRYTPEKPKTAEEQRLCDIEDALIELAEIVAGGE